MQNQTLRGRGSNKWAQRVGVRGRYGQLLEEPRDAFAVRSVEAEAQVQQVQQVQTGTDCTFVLLKSGTLLVSGCNDEGRCGTVTTREKNVDREVKLEGSARITRLGRARACG